MNEKTPISSVLRGEFMHAPCPTCAGEVVGRTDKRYCCVKCKNEHHRIARMQVKPQVKEEKRKLVRNIVLMEGILGAENNCMAIHKNLLFLHGFDMNACSSVVVVNDRNYQHLGDYTFRIEKNGMILVKRNKPLSWAQPEFFARWRIDFPVGIEVENEADLFESDREFSDPIAIGFQRWSE